MRYGSVVGLLLMAWSAGAMAADDGYSPVPGETETQRVVRLTTALETAPGAAAAVEARKWLLRWEEQTHDYTVLVCADLLSPVIRSDTPQHGELMVQSIFGNMAHQIRQGTRTSELDRQVAGMQSMLRSYAVFLAADPAVRIRDLDEMAQAQANGKLRERLAPGVAACLQQR